MKTDKHSSTRLAILIKEKANLSLFQTIKTLEVLYEELKEESLQPLNRSGLYKAHLKLMKNKVLKNKVLIQAMQFCNLMDLHIQICMVNKNVA